MDIHKGGDRQVRVIMVSKGGDGQVRVGMDT